MDARADSSATVPAFNRAAVAAYIPAVSEGQVRDLKESRVLEPSVLNFSTRGSSSYWSVRDVVVLEFAARLSGARFGSFPQAVRAVQEAIPLRIDDLDPAVELYWNGGDIHIFHRAYGADIALDEPSYVGELFSVRDSVRTRHDAALRQSRPVDVPAILAVPSRARGRRGKASRGKSAA